MWQEQDSSLVKEFSFPDFKSGLVFVNKVGKIAEREQHHPDIELGWGKVKISLTTHDQGGVTDKDKALAKEIDTIQE